MSTTKKLNRGLALALILALILCLLPVAAHAFSGTGTQSDPYIIANASDLATFRSNVNGGTSYSGVYFKLTADIMTAQTAVIGTSSTYPFAGTFDGDGHTINVNLSGASRTALFGYVTGTIKNLKVTGSVTSSGSYSGGVVGYLNGGSVLNCGNEASVSATGGYSAGVVGYTGGTCTIDGCYNKGAISGGTRIGGVVGEQYTNVTVSNCYNMASVTGTSSANGGVVGYSRGLVSNCYHAVGIISTSSNGASKGAIIGYMYSSGSMSNCYYVATSTGLKGNSAGTAGTELTVAQMKAAASSLGNYFETDSNSINSDYPILYWQGSGSAPSNTTVTALNGLLNNNTTNITVCHDSNCTNAYANNDIITDNVVYLKNYHLDDDNPNNTVGVDVNTVWTSSAVAVSIPSNGYGAATVTHSDTEALSVTLTAYLTAVVDGVTYTSSDYVRYSFTITQDYGAATTRTVYVSIFNNKNTSNPVITENGGRMLVAVPVTVNGYVNTICVDDALQALHAKYDYSSGYTTSNGMITKLWGITNTNNAFGIYRNDVLTNTVNVETIAEGDLITAFVYNNTSNYTDRYLRFSSPVTTLTAGDSSNVTASLPISYLTYNSSTPTTVSGSSVSVYKMDETTGALSTASTNEITFSGTTLTVKPGANGNYVLLATHSRDGNFITGYKYYVPGVAMVKVNMSNADAVATDKAALTLATGASGEVVSYVYLPSSGSNGTTITWSASPAGIIDSNGLVTRPAEDTQVTLTATITKGSATQTKSFIVTVPERVTNYTSILSSLTTTLTPNSSSVTSSNIDNYLWNIVDVIAYENKSQPATPYITASEKASYYTYAVSYAQDVVESSDPEYSNAQKSNDLSKVMMLLKALDQQNGNPSGPYSASKISLTDSSNETKTLQAWLEYYASAAITEAQALVTSGDDPDAVLDYLHTLAFVLIADLEEPTLATSSFLTNARNLLVNGKTTTTVGNETHVYWTGCIDKDAMILTGLGAYKDKVASNDTDVNNAIEYSVNYLSYKQLANGSFGFEADDAVGNANSTAFVLIALAAVNEDPTDSSFTKNNRTVVDGLLTYYNTSTDLFQYAGADNPMATEQAYRALVAWNVYSGVMSNASYNVYLF